MKSATADPWVLAQQSYGGKCRTFARNSYRQIPGASVEDIEQEMLIELWKCVQKYDPNKGASFNTLFQQCARNRVITLIRQASTKGRTAIVTSLSDEATEAWAESVMTSPDPEEQALMRILIQETIVKRRTNARRGRRAA